MNTVRTVSDAKRTFYSLHTRPVNSIYRRVVEELMVEMHLLTANIEFRYDPIYALGVVTSFDRFMQGYRPEQDLTSIFTAICKAVDGDPQQYRQDADRLINSIGGTSWDGIVGLTEEGEALSALQQISSNPKFKYSRLFAIGLYTLLEKLDAEAVKESEKLQAALTTLGTGLNLAPDKLQKDLELYRSNLEKVSQAQAAMAEFVEAERKKREQREQEKATKASSTSETPQDSESEMPTTES
ncbi:MAG: photosystem II biogenesis protein Psp29 [Alkalinema sp. CACIAM 70d]|nr:MAG: photosystem II biogenesis protein Psp29 [Alkalinema sp. CACIAM 70d]